MFEVKIYIWMEYFWVSFLFKICSIKLAQNSLFQAFAVHGEIEEGAVITDKATGKSRGYGFVTYKNMESAQDALTASSKLIDVSASFLVYFLRRQSTSPWLIILFLRLPEFGEGAFSG